jgi:hypothetical protein
MASQQILTELEELHRQLDRLKPAIKHVEMAEQVLTGVQQIPAKHQELLEIIKKEDTDFKNDLTGLMRQSHVQMKEENSHLNFTTSEIQQQVKREQQYLAELREKVNNYYDIIERINFPDRLDKLDNNVSAIVLAVQSVQNRLDNLERNLVDRIKETAEQQKQSLTKMQETLADGIQKQKVMGYVTWGLIIMAAAAIVLVLKR